MKWVVKKGEEYLTGKGLYTDKVVGAWVFDCRSRATRFAGSYAGRVVKLVRNGKPTPEAVRAAGDRLVGGLMHITLLLAGAACGVKLPESNYLHDAVADANSRIDAWRKATE